MTSIHSGDVRIFPARARFVRLHRDSARARASDYVLNSPISRVSFQMINEVPTVHIAMEYFNHSDPTGSSQLRALAQRSGTR